MTGLKDLAYEKFEDGLKLVFTDDKFFEVVDFIYTTTPQNDTRLKKLVAAHLVGQKQIYGMHKSLEKALRARPELASHMICHEWKTDVPLEAVEASSQ